MGRANGYLDVGAPVSASLLLLEVVFNRFPTGPGDATDTRRSYENTLLL